MAALTEAEILELLADGPRRIYGGPPRALYFDMQERGLIEMRLVDVGSQETAVEVKLSTPQSEITPHGAQP